jgi:hypothetical protein
MSNFQSNISNALPGRQLEVSSRISTIETFNPITFDLQEIQQQIARGGSQPGIAAQYTIKDITPHVEIYNPETQSSYMIDKDSSSIILKPGMQIITHNRGTITLENQGVKFSVGNNTTFTYQGENQRIPNTSTGVRG